jgi:hypothetical protein
MRLSWTLWVVIVVAAIIAWWAFIGWVVSLP